MKLPYHIPVLLQSCINGLNINPDGVYVDATYGGGGHSKNILQHLGPKGRLVVFDHDEDAASNMINDERVCFVRHNFRYVYQFLSYLKAIPADGILADLGVSSHHFDNAGRGFSFRFNDTLDMRMNRETTITAAEILNTYSEEKLTGLFKLYGEIPVARQLSRAIISFNKVKPITTTGELKELALKFAPKKDTTRFISRVFQALRIEVNDETDALRELLQGALEVLKPGGRLVIISYHSLEDRMVKNFFRTGNFAGNEPPTDLLGNTLVPLKVITRKVIVPTDEEVAINPRARSAKLRVAEKL